MKLKSKMLERFHSEESSFSEVELEDPPLGSDATLALSEELGSLIQKESSLAVRLEGLGKGNHCTVFEGGEIAPWGNDDPNEEPSLGVSFEISPRAKFQSLMITTMIDELSLATGVVRQERSKRKSSRKAPMSKLLKEKSTLEKRFNECLGKELAQNTRVKSALREEKDAGKAKEKFVQAVEDRKATESELSNVRTKIDELSSDEGSMREKLGRKEKWRKRKAGNLCRRMIKDGCCRNEKA